MSGHTLDAAIAEYIVECDELVERVFGRLQMLERGVSDDDTVDSLYRDIHTIKGSSQLFGYKDIGDIGHIIETCLEPVRKEKAPISPALFEQIFIGLDLTAKLIGAIKTGETLDLGGEVRTVIDALTAISLGKTATPALSAYIEKDTAPLAPASIAVAVAKVEVAPPVVVAPATVAPKPAPAQVVAVAPPVAVPVPASAPTPKPVTVVAAPVAAPAPMAVVKSAAAAAPAHDHAPAHGDGSDATSTIRVPVSLLDKLMTLMGEMVLVRNQVLQYGSKSDDLGFLNLSQRLDIVTSEMQGEVMKTRMQPIGSILSKFQRVVRDLSRELGKKIDLTLTGTETELDKTLLEAVKDPIMHIVRNSCDHGVEMPDDRRAAGKSDTGTITVRSFHEGGQVVVEISDDGRGLSRDKLLAKAVERGLFTAEKAAQLSDREVFALIFAPGFSTAQKVTNVSGRGVGMDVVKNNIESIGGMVELTSEFGRGTTIRLKIPLTLAIVPTMIVRCGPDRYAIPQVKLLELVRVERNSGAQQIEFLQGQPIFRLRGNLLPLVSLREILGVPGEPVDQLECVNIVVLVAERQTFGLIVDEVQDTAEVVIKPMSSFLKSLTTYSGATVLGDGSVALIIDVVGLAQSQKLVGKTKSEEKLEATRAPIDTDEQEFLLFRVNSPTKHAIPLNLVHRLEEIPKTSVEYSGSQRVIRYRNSILPIVSLNEYLGLEASIESQGEMISLIVAHKDGRSYGIEVDEILDVMLISDWGDNSFADRPGIMGNAVSKDEIIVLIDTLEVLKEISSKFTPMQDESEHKGRRVLFLEDTAIFKKHVMRALEESGFIVTHAEDGVEALKILNDKKPGEFDLILSDIEMPNMNGLQFIANIRRLDEWKHVPAIALTTRFNPSFVAEGLAAGFDSYLEKLNKEILLAEIVKLMDPGYSRKKAA